MKISKEIQAKMHRIAKLANECSTLVKEVETYLKNRGINVDELRDGSGCGFDDLEYQAIAGEDITEELIKRIEEEY